MSWYGAMKGQKSWKDVLPGRKRALRPRVADKPPLPKLDARTRKQLVAEDRKSTRPYGHAADPPPREVKRPKKERLANERKRNFVEAFVASCKPLASELTPLRYEMSFYNWKLLYHWHRLSPTVAAKALSGVGLVLAEKIPGLRAWTGPVDPVAVAAELYKDK